MPDNIFAVTYSKEHYKVKGEQDSTQLFPDVDLSNPQPFNKKYLAEEDEILFIELSDDNQNFIQPFINNVTSSASLNLIPENCCSKVNLLYVGCEVSTNVYNIKFQRIWNKYYFKKTWFSLSLNDCNIKKNASLIMLTGNTDLFWESNTKRLYFKNFKTAKAIFPQLENFYRKATEADLTQFKNSPLISVPNNSKFGERALKKIASIIDDKVLDSKNIADLQSYAQEYNQTFPPLEGNKIKIASNKDVELLYKLLNELFYTTQGSHEKRAVNSIQKIENATENH